MANLIHFLNGRFVTEDELLISPRDLGLVRGYAVTDFLVTYNHLPFKLNEHIDRLFSSAEMIGLQIPWTKAQVASWVRETLDRNDKDTEKTVKILLTGGTSHSMYQAETPTLIMMVNPRVRHPPSAYEQGIKVKAIRYKRQQPEAKHTHYLEAVKQLATVKNDNINDLIYYDDSQVYEGSGCSLFVVIDNTLVTAKSNVIDGITRKTLLETIQLTIPIVVRDFTFDELQNASEIFLTGSNSEVRGVIEINGKPVGDGKVGAITKEVLRQYQEYLRTFTQV